MPQYENEVGVPRSWWQSSSHGSSSSSASSEEKDGNHWPRHTHPSSLQVSTPGEADSLDEEGSVRHFLVQWLDVVDIHTTSVSQAVRAAQARFVPQHNDPDKVRR